jgi:type VI secretion system protein ImpA
MATPETVELGALLAPIAGDSPSGEPLLYAGTYDQIKEARQSGDRSQLGTQGRPADWRGVVRVASEALSTRTKDLQIGVWLTEALTNVHGFAGLRDGLRVLRGLHEGFWESVHPAVEDGDLGFRAGTLNWLNEKLPASVLAVAVTDPAGGTSYGWLEWKESRDVDNLARQSPERYAEAVAEGRLTGEQFDKAVAAGPRRFYEAIFADVTAALDECGRLEAAVLEKFGRDAPSLLSVHKAIEDCHDVVLRIVREKRMLEPDAGDIEVEGAGVAGPVAGAAPRGGPLPLEPVDRADAIRRLAAVASYFRRTEPHSPVAYLVQRAMRWAEMPLEDWLQEVIASDDILGRVKETLGIKGG